MLVVIEVAFVVVVLVVVLVAVLSLCVAFIWRRRVSSLANFLWQWPHKIGFS